MPKRVRKIAAAIALAAVCLSAEAHAQDVPIADSAVEARQQYQLGTQAFQAKRYSEAALHFEAAAAFRAHAVALYTAGLAWDLAARPERAADAYSRAIDVGGLDAKQDKVAKERVAALERSLGTLTVTAPEGWKVQLDTFTEVPTPARLHGPPGVHGLSVRAAGRPIERRDVSLEGGKTTSLDLKDEPRPAPKVEPEAPKTAPKEEPPPPPTVAPRESFWSPRRVVGVGIAGVGLAALGGGAVLGINANSAKDAYDAGPTRDGFDHASSLETWTNVALVSGAVLLVGGIVLVALPEKDSFESRVRSALLRGGGTF